MKSTINLVSVLDCACICHTTIDKIRTLILTKKVKTYINGSLVNLAEVRAALAGKLYKCPIEAQEIASQPIDLDYLSNRKRKRKMKPINPVVREQRSQRMKALWELRDRLHRIESKAVLELLLADK